MSVIEPDDAAATLVKANIPFVLEAVVSVCSYNPLGTPIAVVLEPKYKFIPEPELLIVILYFLLPINPMFCSIALTEPVVYIALFSPKLQLVPKVQLSLGSTCLTDTLSIEPSKELGLK